MINEIHKYFQSLPAGDRAGIFWIGLFVIAVLGIFIAHEWEERDNDEK